MLIRKCFSCSYNTKLLVKLKSFFIQNVCSFSLYLRKGKTVERESSLKFLLKPKFLSVVCSCHTYTSSTKDVMISTDESSSELKEKLLGWAIQFRVSQIGFSQLLKILSQNGLKNIPPNSRSLMKAKEDKIKVYQMPSGVYVHYKIEKSLKEIILILEKKQKLKEKNVNLSVFIDYLTLKRSKKGQEGLWVILGSLDMKETIFLISTFFGRIKLDHSNLFLSEFIKEAKTLCSNGLLVNNSTYNIGIKRIICDSPAKAYVLNIKFFTAYSSCTKCTAKGEYFKNRICFPEKSEARTDKDFQSKGLLRGEKTKLLEIPNFSITYNMPNDYLHLVCFGVIKKLIIMWLGEAEKYIISGNKIKGKLKTINETIPVELRVKEKAFKEYKNWSMFQYRKFFLYYMPFVFESSLHNQYYEHFLLLYSACRIFSTTAYPESISLGEKMLNNFVETFIILYGKENVSCNVHNLFHLADDYKLHGPLDNFSSFYFEKYLLKLKESIKRTKKKSFPQTILYYSQQFISLSNLKKLYVNEVRTRKKLEVDSFLVKNFNATAQFAELNLKNKKIIPSNPNDKYVILKNGKIIEVAHVVQIKKQTCIVGKQFLIYKNFWVTPIESSHLNIFKVRSLSDSLDIWSIDEISQKCLRLPLNSEEFLIIPILENNR